MVRVKEAGADHRSGGRMGSGEHVRKGIWGGRKRGVVMHRDQVLTGTGTNFSTGTGTGTRFFIINYITVQMFHKINFDNFYPRVSSQMYIQHPVPTPNLC